MMDTARKCRQELIAKIKENVLDRLDLTKNIVDEVLPQFVEDPEAVWLIKYRDAEWLIMYPTEDKFRQTDFISMEFTVVGCNIQGEWPNNGNELDLLFTLADLYRGGFRHVPRDELPTYISWPYLAEKINGILKG